MNNNYTFNPQELESVIRAFKKSKRYNSRILFGIGIALTMLFSFMLYMKANEVIYYLLFYFSVVILLFYLSVVVLGKNIKCLQSGNYKCTLTTFSSKRTHYYRGGQTTYIVTHDFPHSEVRSIDIQHGDGAMLGDEILILQISRRKYAIAKRFL